MNETTRGSCLCGQITFEIIGEFDSFYLCHCKHCQKDTGSAHAANLFATNAKLNWLSGQKNSKTFNLAQTRHAKSFCSNCGSALPMEQANGQLLVVPAGSLDSPVSLKPNAHIFCASQANWEEAMSEAKKFDQFPE